jgi:hypothetical protein
MRLARISCATYHGNARYVVFADLASGRRNRYEVIVQTSGDPVVIGRELDLTTVRAVIRRFDALATGYTGSRRAALRIMRAAKHRGA